MGIPLALALLTILFHEHNKKIADVEPCSILSARAAYRYDDDDNDNTSNRHPQFGILKKTNTPNIDCWIFGPQMHDNFTGVSVNQLSFISAQTLSKLQIYKILQLSYSLL